MKRSSDCDFVPKPKRARTAAGPPPQPKPLPSFEPFQIHNYREDGEAQLPDSIKLSSETLEFDIFSLFFTLEIIQHLINATNENARVNLLLNKPFARRWYDVTPQEIYGWIGITLRIGLYLEGELT